MSKRKKKLKKRRQKQLKKALKGGKVAEITPLEVYQNRLNEIYNGSVKVLKGNVINSNSTIFYRCKECNREFYGKASHMVGAKHQRHMCGMPYGISGQERSPYVGGKRYNTITKGKPIDEELFHQLVWEDHSPKQIASKLQVNLQIIKYFFEREGLL